MGYATAMGECGVCKRVFTFNPVKVPSFRFKTDGPKEPICGECMVAINLRRKTEGLPAHPVLPDAYEACDESELGEG